MLAVIPVVLLLLLAFFVCESSLFVASNSTSGRLDLYHYCIIEYTVDYPLRFETVSLE